jgi:hypothetical protein
MTRQDIEIAAIPKNSRESYNVGIRDFRGCWRIDLRIFSFNGVAKVATPKGLAIKPDALRPIIEALEKAELAAKAEGLL